MSNIQNDAQRQHGGGATGSQATALKCTPLHTSYVNKKRGTCGVQCMTVEMVAFPFPLKRTSWALLFAGASANLHA